MSGRWTHICLMSDSHRPLEMQVFNTCSVNLGSTFEVGAHISVNVTMRVFAGKSSYAHRSNVLTFFPEDHGIAMLHVSFSCSFNCVRVLSLPLIISWPSEASPSFSRSHFVFQLWIIQIQRNELDESPRQSLRFHSAEHLSDGVLPLPHRGDIETEVCRTSHLRCVHWSATHWARYKVVLLHISI